MDNLDIDRRLLTLAARAASVPIFWDESRGPYLAKSNGTAHTWNPLTDDGDALRLAVSLSMRVYNYSGCNDRCVIAACEGGKLSGWAREEHGADHYAAARRAIVRAAASLAGVDSGQQ